MFSILRQEYELIKGFGHIGCKATISFSPEVTLFGDTEWEGWLVNRALIPRFNGPEVQLESVDRSH